MTWYCSWRDEGWHIQVTSIVHSSTWQQYAFLLVLQPASYSDPNVTIALIKGVAIAFCRRTGKIPYNQSCFLTSFEPNKVYLGPNRNNKGVAGNNILLRPEISRFYWMSFYLYYWYYELHYLAYRHHRHLLLSTPLPLTRIAKQVLGGLLMSR